MSEGSSGEAVSRSGSAIVLLEFLAAALLPQSADAQRYGHESANDMVPNCKKFLAPREGPDNRTPAWGQGVCRGIIPPLNEPSQFSPPHLRSCSPDGVTSGQAVRVVLAYIERRPQRMHENFKSLAIEALHEAWPC